MSDLHTLEFPKRSPQGIALVIGIHALILWGLASGLSTHFIKKDAPPVTLIDTPDKAKPIEPPPPVPHDVKFATVEPTRVTPIEIQVEQTVSPILAKADPDATHREVRPSEGRQIGPTTTEPARVQPGPARAEAVCDVMSVPEMPAVNWTGRATLKIQAQLAAGQVASVQFLNVAGGMDARTRRALQSAVQTALGSYQCRGNQVFEQEFVFNIQ